VIHSGIMRNWDIQHSWGE